MQVIDLTCEFCSNPLAIGSLHPRLGWRFRLELENKNQRNKLQTAYHILVASTQDLLKNNDADIWNTGKIISNQSIHVEYNGKPLQSRQKYYWKVKTWDEAGIESLWSESAWWIMGILEPSSWDNFSHWIGIYDQLSFKKRFPNTFKSGMVFSFVWRFTHQRRLIDQNPENKFACGYYLRKEFSLQKDKSEIERAILRIAGLGYHEIMMNGQKIGNHVLDPAASDYSKRVYYVSYDVKEALLLAKNCIGIILGSGWFSVGTPDLFQFEKAPWNAPPRCRMELEIRYNSGESQFIGTDSTWLYTDEGPIRFNCVRSGEIYDARMDLGAWTTVDGNVKEDGRWKSAKLVSSPQGQLYPQLNPPITIERSIFPILCTEPIPGILVYHFPENCAGWINIKVKGKSGQKISIRLNEKLKSNGQVDMKIHSSHTFGRFQTCEYICSGRGIESWHPQFCYQGFQFVEIEGISREEILSIETQLVHTAVARVGEFSCSNPLINQIDDISRRTFLNGLHSYPEDCPQREKGGWTEDGMISAQGSIYNFDGCSIYEKWIYDLIDSQTQEGQVPDLVPTPGWGKPNPIKSGDVGKMADPWWGGAIILLPWTLYRHYDDRRILIESYPAIKKYLAFLQKTANKDLEIRWPTLLGDWLEVGAAASAHRTPRQLTATQGFYFFSKIAAQIAKIIGNDDDSQKFTTLASKIGNYINSRYFDSSTGLYSPDSQSAQAIALVTEQCPKSLQVMVKNQLLLNIREIRHGHLSTGIVGTYFLFQALAQNMAADLAYEILTIKDYPGYEYMLSYNSPLQAKTTTLWEDWGGKSSLCHPVQGCVISFLYESLAGIQPVLENPGFKKVVIAPQFVSGLHSVNCQLETFYGLIRSKWEIKDNQLLMHITVPINTKAEIRIPAQISLQIFEGDRLIETCQEIKEIIFPQLNHPWISFIVGSGDYFFHFSRAYLN